MNKRIQKLIAQATHISGPDDPYSQNILYLYAGYRPRPRHESFDKEEFVKLIVLECAGIFEGLYTYQQRPERIDTRIKQHFGV
jgi:hypothetical protein